MNTDKLEQQLTSTTERPTEVGSYWFQPKGLMPLMVRVVDCSPVLIRWQGKLTELLGVHDGGTWTGPLDLDAMREAVKQWKADVQDGMEKNERLLDETIELGKEVDRLTAELSTMSTLLLKASCKFQAVGDSFTSDGSPTNGDYYRALAKECEQAATAEGGE